MKRRSKHFHFTRTYKILLIAVVLLIILRLLLPYILLRYCNKSLSELNGYYGHIEDIDVSLYRGAYQINNMYLNKVDAKTHKQTEFFKVNNIDLSVEWHALFRGKLVGEFVFNSPKLIFTKNRTEISDVKKDTNDFRKVLKDFMPLKVNRFEVYDGSIHYADPGATPKVDISIQQAHIIAENLKNVEDNKTELPSPVTANANVYGGTLSLNMKMDALAQRTRFDLNAEIKNANLPSVNDFLKAYGGFDVHKGTLSLYTEFAAKNGRYKGYVKPVIKDLDVVGPEDRKDKFFQKVWENVVGGAGKILENPKKDQVATKVPIEGDFTGSNTDIIETIWELLRNAFIHALMPSIDNQINISSLNTHKDDHKGLFHKIFGGKDKDKKDKHKD
jgi:hypothetical protein